MWNAELGSEPLVHSIIQKIKHNPMNAISFRDYMEMCLYHPEHGYYMSSRVKVGKQGDFYTSSSIGSVMGEMLARFMMELREPEKSEAESFHIVEWGGGTGRLAAHLLDEIRDGFPASYEEIRYTVIEQNPYHRNMQRETLKEHLEHVLFMSADEWYETGEPRGTIIFSNELLDAFPVHRVRSVGGSLYEIYVAWDDLRKCFYEKLEKLSEEDLLGNLRQENVCLSEGQTIEINPAARQWVRHIGEWLDFGHLITIDYGDVVDEIYAKHRMNGTLICYYKHQAHDNPYLHVGEQDMTSHINFSACIRAGQQVGLEEWSLNTQKQFLVNAGILDKLRDHGSNDPFDQVARKNRAIRQLLLSDQMSELFKVLVQKKKKGG